MYSLAFIKTLFQLYFVNIIHLVPDINVCVFVFVCLFICIEN